MNLSDFLLPLNGILISSIFFVLWFVNRSRLYFLYWGVGNLLISVATAAGVVFQLNGSTDIGFVIFSIVTVLLGATLLVNGTIIYRGEKIPVTLQLVLLVVSSVSIVFIFSYKPLFSAIIVNLMVAIAFFVVANFLFRMGVFEKIVAVLYILRGINTSTIWIFSGSDSGSLSLSIGLLLNVSCSLGLLLAAFLRSEYKLHSKNSLLELLNNLTAQVYTCKNETEVAKKAISVLQRYDSPAYMSVHVLSKDKTTLYMLVAHGFSGDVIDKEVKIPAEGLIDRLHLERNDITIFDDSSLSPAAGLIKKTLSSAGIKCGALVPLLGQGNIIGILNICYKEPRVFSRSKLLTLKGVGETIGMALVSVRHLDQLEYRAMHDSLTRLPNRYALHKDIKQLLDDSVSGFALLLIDLDRFKDINDTLGHEVGDDFLRSIGTRVSNVLDASVGQTYRLGGDEFAVVITETKQTVLEYTEKISTSICCPIEVSGMSLSVGCSIGIAIHPTDGVNSHELLRCSDIAMYSAKHQTKSIALYDKSNDKHTVEKLQLAAEMPIALQENQFFLCYQPQVSLVTDQLIGCEALIRWQHPVLGFLSPDRFLPLAEVSVFIHSMTLWVAEEAFRQQQAWREQGLDIPISINLSVRNLLATDFSRKLKKIIDKYPADSVNIELELTETALMADLKSITKVLFELIHLGFKISLDDFGTGYSSLSHLQCLPIDTLKIDQSFVMNMLNDNESNKIVKSTIHLAKDLGKNTVAEGVEDTQTMIELKKMGCDIVQGYFISRPLKADQFLAWSNERSNAKK